MMDIYYQPTPFKADIPLRYSDRDWALEVIKKWKIDHASLRPVSMIRRSTWVQQIYYAAELKRYER